MTKLDYPLQRLVLNEQSSDAPYTVRTRNDGEKVYGVIIRSSDPEALREAEIPIGSTFGDVITAYLTVEELKRAARLPAVRYVENSTRREINR